VARHAQEGANRVGLLVGVEDHLAVQVARGAPGGLFEQAQDHGACLVQGRAG
jgi:hypothetical protein